MITISIFQMKRHMEFLHLDPSHTQLKHGRARIQSRAVWI